MKKSIYKIKLILAVIVFTGLFSSCQGLLDVPSNSLLSDDVVFAQPDSAAKAIVAIYDIIGQNNSYRNRLWLQMGYNNDVEYKIGTDMNKSDNLFPLYNANAAVGDGYNNADAANPWSRIYQGIERANLAIKGIREYGNPVAGSNMGHFLGEALTMRAFFYYDLIKWWGDVPARFEPVSEATIYLPKSDRDVIYNQIIADLQEATNLLYGPNTPLTLTTKRISKDAARGLLARICLSAAGYSMRPVGTNDAEIKITASAARQTELYTIAREACRAIIADKQYSLASDFKQIFYDQCQDVETHGREAIWQLPYSYGIRGQLLRYFALPRKAEFDALPKKNNTIDIGGFFKIMPTLYYDFHTKDKRRDVTMVPYKVEKNTTLNVMEQSLSSGATGFNVGKWRAEWLKMTIIGNDDGVSPIILRYADVLLMFAEADLFLGGTEGTEYFNQVRRRAFEVPLNVVSAYDLPLTLNNIKNERAFEFAGENIRKYDLIRWGELKSGIDKASQKLRNLRDAAGEYADVPQVLYTRYTVDNTITAGERVLEIYGLQRGETDDKTLTDPAGGWVKKTWIQGVSSTTGESVFNELIDKFYINNPDKKQLLPIMNQIIITSNGALVNDYGY